MATSWTDKPAADPATSWNDDPAADPATSWSEDPSSNPTAQNLWDFDPRRTETDRLARDWQTERLVFLNTEDWTTWQTENMKEGGVEGYTPPPVTLDTQDNSLSLDGVNEGLNDWLPQTTPFTNPVFTMATWIRIPAAATASRAIIGTHVNATTGTVLDIGNVYFRTGSAADKIQCLIYDAAGTMKRHWMFNNCRLDNVWQHWVWTFNANENSEENPANKGRLRLYLDGVKLSDYNAYADTNWQPTAWWNNHWPHICNIGGGAFVAADIYNIAWWEVEFTQAEVTAIYNSGTPMDYSASQPAIGYLQDVNLHYWWRLGHDPADIGKNYGLDPLGTGWDIDANSMNVDATDIIASWPGSP
jgi:hypothetical protein